MNRICFIITDYYIYSKLKWPSKNVVHIEQIHIYVQWIMIDVTIDYIPYQPFIGIPGNNWNSGKFWEILGILGNPGNSGKSWEYREILGMPGNHWNSWR